MNRRTSATIFGLLLLASVAVGCSSGSSSSNSDSNGAPATTASGSNATVTPKSSASIDPCSLLSSAQVSSALSRPVGPPTTIKVTQVPPNGSACNWEATAKQGELIFRTARVDLWNWSSLPADWTAKNPSPTTYAQRLCDDKVAAATKIDIPGFVACRFEFLTYVANDKYLAIIGVPNLAQSPEAETASVQLAKNVAAQL